MPFLEKLLKSSRNPTGVLESSRNPTGVSESSRNMWGSDKYCQFPLHVRWCLFCGFMVVSLSVVGGTGVMVVILCRSVGVVVCHVRAVGTVGVDGGGWEGSIVACLFIVDDNNLSVGVCRRSLWA